MPDVYRSDNPRLVFVIGFSPKYASGGMYIKCNKTVSIKCNKTTNYSAQLYDILSKFPVINLKSCPMYAPVGIHSNRVGLF